MKFSPFHACQLQTQFFMLGDSENAAKSSFWTDSQHYYAQLEPGEAWLAIPLMWYVLLLKCSGIVLKRTLVFVEHCPTKTMIYM